MGISVQRPLPALSPGTATKEKIPKGQRLSLSWYPCDRRIKLIQRKHPDLWKREGEVNDQNTREVEREKKRKFGPFPAVKGRGEQERLVEGGRPNQGREWTRPEGAGVERRRTHHLEGDKNGDPAPRTGPSPRRPLGATLLGRMVLGRGAAAHRWLRPQRGAQAG